jgi:hypothetical protein
MFWPGLSRSGVAILSLVARFADRFDLLKYHEKTHLSKANTPPGPIRQTARDYAYVVLRVVREGYALFEGVPKVLILS